MDSVPEPPVLPKKYDLFGVQVSEASYATELGAVLHAAKTCQALCVTHLAVHGLVEGASDQELQGKLNEFDIVAPDGQGVRHALNLLHKIHLPENCRGPESICRICEGAAAEGVGVYFYGSTQSTVEALAHNLGVRFEGLTVVGAEPSLFRPLTEAEFEDLVGRINASRAGVVFIGLGCPLQEHFAHKLKPRVHAAVICVGAAFDFHAGNKKMAPVWVQKCSLEWLYRLLHEPRRLFKRYLITNSIFVLKLLGSLCSPRRQLRGQASHMEAE